MGIFVGIDGGGSKTSCVVGDEKALLGHGSAGPSNIVRVGEKQAREAIAEALRQACDMAQIAPSQVQRTCAGVAGGARLETAAIVRRLLTDLIPGSIEVVGDMVIALEAAFGPGPGAVVVSGTGSIAYGCNAANETARAGGWGYAISDEGSGHWIGRTAVAALMRIHDEGWNPPLLDSVKKAWRVATHEQLVLMANASPPPDFASLLPLVLSAADGGDPTAITVLNQAGGELASLAKIVLHRLFLKDPARVAMSGGVFRNSALVRQAFYNSLRSEFPPVVVKPEIADSVNGALELARRGTRVTHS